MSSPLQNADKVANSAPVTQRPITPKKALEVSFEPKDTEVSARKPDAHEIAEYIVMEMIKNTSPQKSEFIRVKDLFQEFKDSNNASALRVTALLRALLEFKSLVDYRSKWDHKKYIEDTWGRSSVLFGAEIPHDTWSNIHYGFVGRQIGFNPELLLTAAGYMQWYKSDISRDWLERWMSGQTQYLGQSLDHPEDQASINIGMKLSDTVGRDLQSSDLIVLLKKFMSQISKK